MKTRQFTLKSSVVALSAMLALSSGLATASHGNTYDTPAFQDRAKVIATSPIYDRINEPRRECFTEYQTYEEHSYRNGNNTGGAVLGAIVGGLIGSTVGKGNGKVAAAAVGAATGAVVGDRWNDRGNRYTTTETRPVETCRMVDNYRQEITGYDVTYRYHGKEFSTRLPYHPGEWLNVNVSVSIAEERPSNRWNNSRNRWFDE
jgi:uncharacterized protein YcfJ